MASRLGALVRVSSRRAKGRFAKGRCVVCVENNKKHVGVTKEDATRTVHEEINMKQMVSSQTIKWRVGLGVNYGIRKECVYKSI